LCFVFCHRSAADAFAYGDARTRGLSLKGAQPQIAPLQQIKADPVDIRQECV
jgi:hypothetical protein